MRNAEKRGKKEEWSGETAERPNVLVVDDEELSARMIRRLLEREGYETEQCSDAETACERITRYPYDVVLTDLCMPGLSGIDLIRRLRASQPGVAFILMTGLPELDTAMTAIELGAVRYLCKPIDRDALLTAVADGAEYSRMHQSDQVARELLAVKSEQDAAEQVLHQQFDQVLEDLRMAYQPIQRSRDERIGFEALLRNPAGGALAGPAEVLAAAETLGRVAELGQVVRSRVADAIRSGAVEGSIFVNLHSLELDDPTLLDGKDPLAEFAESVVLEITERGRLEIDDRLVDTLARLREMGYRIALDDLGAGYATLESLILLRPDIVKLDMSLTSGADRDPMREELVRGITRLARQSEIQVVAEGVETEQEYETLRQLECHFFQGYLLGRPQLLG